MAKKVQHRRPVHKVEGRKAAGSYLLVELLEPAEILNTSFALGGNTQVDAPQAYVLDIGPSLDAERYGVQVGDRIVFSGGFVVVPKTHEEQRTAGVIDINAVRAVLKEGEDLQQSNLILH